MLATIEACLRALLDLGRDNLTVGQMLTRTLVVYTTALTIVRLSEKRCFGKNTAFDFVVSILRSRDNRRRKNVSCWR